MAEPVESENSAAPGAFFINVVETMPFLD